MKKTLLQVCMMTFLSMMFIVTHSIVTKADGCSHDWYEYDKSYSEIDSKQHEITYYYECYNCYDTKTETINQNHSWEEREGDIEYSNTNANVHTITHYYYCEDCGAEKIETEKKPHNWKEYSWKDCEKVNDGQHVIKKYFECDDCGAEKTDSKKENHKLKLDYSDSYKSISSEQHSYKGYYNCSECGGNVEKVLKENHKFDKYGVCTECDYCKSRNITLSPNKVAYVNNNTWIKINIKKNGYICLTGSERYGGYYYWKLYNKSKKLFTGLGGGIDKDNCKYVAIKKGTYYLKTDEAANIKYVFYKDPSKKNYTKKSAVKLKKNKKVKGVIYSSANKKTWTRYYVIDLKKKQYIHLAESYSIYDSSYSIYDSKGYYVSMTDYYNSKGDWDGYVSDYKMPKGKYYIVVSASWTPATKNRTMGRYFEITWR